MVRLILCVITAGLFVTTAPAADKKDTGKKLLTKLFQDVIVPATDCTVRIKADGKDTALGTIVSKEGYILTKGSELRGELTCQLRDGTAYDAEYVGYHRETDLALLKIEADDLVTAKFAPSKAAEPGNWVAVPSITSEPIAVGVISSVARKLYNEERIIENANKGYLGIRYSSAVTDDGPVVIGEVMKGLAADKAGLKINDAIIEINGKAVKNREMLPEILDGYRPGDVITMKVKRKVMGKDEPEVMTFKVTLSPRSQMSRGDMQNAFGGSLSGRRTGFPQVIQHDTVIVPQDCGGPLVDLEGRILGINIARAGRVETWALPAEVITPVLAELKAGKYPVANKKTSTKD